jgi:hypothetical protein
MGTINYDRQAGERHKQAKGTGFPEQIKIKKDGIEINRDLLERGDGQKQKIKQKKH